MVETLTKECVRCETEFDIDEQYREAVIVDHPHPEDVEHGNGMVDQRYTLCGHCSVDFLEWLEPEDKTALQVEHAESEPGDVDLF